MSNFITFLDLYKANPVAARKKILEVYIANGGNISKTARQLKCDRKTVRKAVKRFKAEGEKGLKDKSRRPRNSPTKTPLFLEQAIVNLHKKHGWGRYRILRELKNTPEYAHIVTEGKVKSTLRRRNLSGKYNTKRAHLEKDAVIMIFPVYTQ